jgi:hypothetical protein
MSKTKDLFTLEQSIAQEAEIRLLERIDESIKARQNSYSLWRLWAKALGEKASDSAVEADDVAIFRTVLAAINLVTCLFIIAGIIRHW